jgi:hypothetical protein
MIEDIIPIEHGKSGKDRYVMRRPPRFAEVGVQDLLAKTLASTALNRSSTSAASRALT